VDGPVSYARFDIVGMAGEGETRVSVGMVLLTAGGEPDVLGIGNAAWQERAINENRPSTRCFKIRMKELAADDFIGHLSKRMREKRSNSWPPGQPGVL